MDIFTFEDNRLQLNKTSILLVKEFAELWEPMRNRIDGDKSGYDRKRAYKEFTYIYLMYDWESPYKNFSEVERHLTAVEDCGLSKKFLEDEKFLAACRKYQDMQDTIEVKLLKSAYKSCTELTLFYTNVDLQERDMEGRYILNHKQVMDSIANLGKMVAGLEVLQEVVRKQKEANAPKLRGDIEPGMFD